MILHNLKNLRHACYSERRDGEDDGRKTVIASPAAESGLPTVGTWEL